MGGLLFLPPLILILFRLFAPPLFRRSGGGAVTIYPTFMSQSTAPPLVARSSPDKRATPRALGPQSLPTFVHIVLI